LATGASSGLAGNININPRFTDFIGNVASGLAATVSQIFGAITFYNSNTTFLGKLSNGIVSGCTVHSSNGGFGTQTLSSLDVYDCNAWRIAASTPGFAIFQLQGIRLFNCNFWGNL